MNRNEFNGQLDTAIDGMASAFARKGVSFPEEFNDIPGAQKLGVPEPKKGGGHYGKVSPYEPAMRNFIKEEAGKLFAPWKDLPDPVAFDTPLQQVVDARSVLANKEITHVGDIKDMKLGTQMQGNLADVKTNIAGWHGQTVHAFNRNYVEHFDEMLYLQVNSLRVLEVSLQAHREGVVKSQEGTLDLVRNATAAVDAIDCFGGDSNKNVVFNVVAGMLGVLAAAVSPVNALVAIAVVAGGLGTAKDLVSSKEPATLPLGAGRINGVWSNLESAEDRHKQLYTEGEDTLSRVVSLFESGLKGHFKTGTGGDGHDISSRGLDLIRLHPPIAAGDVRPPS